MKLIFCKSCQDVVKLKLAEERSCSCGKCSGAYTDNLNAWYSGGEYVVPLGFANPTLGMAVANQPESGWGKRFEAFVIPKECPTFKHIP